jgi:hypothetical protein
MNLKLRRRRDSHGGNRGRDFDVIDGDGQIIGRILKPGGGAEHWFWALRAVVLPPLRGSGTAPTRDDAAAFRAAWEAQQKAPGSPPRRK